MSRKRAKWVYELFVGADLSRPSPIMIFHEQGRDCHPERSEGSDSPGTEILRCAQDDKTLPILNVKNHYRPAYIPIIT